MDSRSTSSGLPTCARCGEVIGVYELAVMVLEGEVCDTSHLVRVEGEREGTLHFHRACFEA